MNYFILITAVIVARIIEAWRDAEIFGEPLESRSLAWHLLKIPQFALWMVAGKVFADTEWGLVAGVGLAWLIFEIFLDVFRKRYQ